VVLVHLDTDIGTNPDDACALAMLLGWAGCEVTAVTTTDDVDGGRAAEARRLLALAGRDDVPGRPGSDPGAGDVLAASVDAGATVVAVGPLANLAALATTHPGALDRAGLVVMGGWVRPLDPDLPAWGPERDWNVQRDPHAAEVVAAAGADLTLVTLADTLRTHLRQRDLARLGTAGPVGELLGAQAVAYAASRGHADLARRHRGLPDDLLLFLHDPLTCAVALGWDGVTLTTRRLRAAVSDGLLTWEPADAAPSGRVVTGVDGAAFREAGLTAVVRLVAERP
jgi:inosine-uridine nucleoside N-ribohydrolase